MSVLVATFPANARGISRGDTRVGTRVSGFDGFRAQTSVLTRVPCPGGRGACAGGAEALSSASLSTLTSGLGSLASGAFTGTGGGTLETLEILMIAILASFAPGLWARGGERFMNPIAKSRGIGIHPGAW